MSKKRQGLFLKNWGMNTNSVMHVPLQNPSHGTPRRRALAAVRGDEPDCPGKHNLLTALIVLQCAADRCGNRGTRF
jgi:hypothetical protein